MRDQPVWGRTTTAGIETHAHLSRKKKEGRKVKTLPVELLPWHPCLTFPSPMELHCRLQPCCQHYRLEWGRLSCLARCHRRRPRWLPASPPASTPASCHTTTASWLTSCGEQGRANLLPIRPDLGHHHNLMSDPPLKVRLLLVCGHFTEKMFPWEFKTKGVKSWY